MANIIHRATDFTWSPRRDKFAHFSNNLLETDAEVQKLCVRNAQGGLIWEREYNFTTLMSVSWSSKGDKILTVDSNDYFSVITVWNVLLGEQIIGDKLPPDSHNTSFGPRENTYIYTKNAKMYIVDFSSPARQTTEEVSYTSDIPVAFSPDKKQIATLVGNRLTIRDISTNLEGTNVRVTFVQTLALQRLTFNEILWSPTKKHIAVRATDYSREYPGVIYVIDAKTLRRVYTKKITSPIQSFAWDDAGRNIVSVHKSGDLVVWKNIGNKPLTYKVLEYIKLNPSDTVDNTGATFSKYNEVLAVQSFSNRQRETSYTFKDMGLLRKSKRKKKKQHHGHI